MTDILATGTSALLAFQRAMATISHNVANANTPGYSRQQVLLSARPGQFQSYGFIGTGVDVTSVQRMVNTMLTGQLQNSSSEMGRLTSLSGLADPLAQYFSGSDTGIAKPMSNFFDSLQAVSSNPTSVAARQSFLGSAKSLANTFNQLQGQLQQADSQIDQTVTAGVASVNQLTTQIAALNQQISNQSNGGQPPNDLLDQRDQLVLQLSNQVGVTTTAGNNGALNVFTTGGQALVLGNQIQKLTTVSDPYQPSRHSLALATSGGNIVLPDSSIGGSIGGLLQTRSTVIDPMQAQLGQAAAGVSAAINSQNAQGIDLYGNMGGNVFSTPTPAVFANSHNTGSATLNTSVNSAGALGTTNFVMHYDGSNWSATDASTGAAVTLSGSGTSASPFVVNGVSVTVGGSATAGDSFLVQPTAQAAGQIGVTMTDPNRLAAASPIRGSAATSNTGNASMGGMSVVDATNPNLQSPVTIQFTSANTYSINGSGSYTYTSGSPITVNGWSMNISGTPAAGDSFNVTANGPNSSDNSNANVLAGLDSNGLLNGGTTSLTQAVSQLTSTVGSLASQADYALSARTSIDTQLNTQASTTSGVNLDEEAANMVKYQQAYQAASQIINVANETFQTLLSAVRS
jgi:flagellar hook-associated protein 1 FlgK